MKLDFEIQTGYWIVIPRSFPTPDGLAEQEWFEIFLEPYIDQYGPMDEALQATFSGVVAESQRNILPEDVATILYRPLNLPVFGLLHLQLFEGVEGDVDEIARRGLLPDSLFALPPVIEPYETEKLGTGTKAAFLLSEQNADGSRSGGLSYVFGSNGTLVRAFTHPATSSVVGLMEDLVDWIVNTIEVTEGDVAGVIRRN